METSRDSVWAYRIPSAPNPCTTTKGIPRPQTAKPTSCPLDRRMRCLASRDAEPIRAGSIGSRSGWVMGPVSGSTSPLHSVPSSSSGAGSDTKDLAGLHAVPGHLFHQVLHPLELHLVPKRGHEAH